MGVKCVFGFGDKMLLDEGQRDVDLEFERAQTGFANAELVIGRCFQFQFLSSFNAAADLFTGKDGEPAG